MCGKFEIPAILGLYVFLTAYIWWMSSKFEELLKEIKKK